MIYPLNRSQILRLKLDTFICTLPMSTIASILQGLKNGCTTSADKIQIDRVTLLEELGRIHHLQLAYLRISNGRMAVLGRALQEAPFPNLEELHLPGNSMAVESVKTLARAMELGQLSRLNLLDLSNNAIGDEGCEILCRSLPLRSVSTLSLSDCGVTSAGVEALAEALRSHQSSFADDLAALKNLDLSYNHIGKEGAENIAQCLQSGQLWNLENINLCSTSIGDGGVKAIGLGFAEGKVLALRELDLSLNVEVDGTEGVTAIARALESKHLTSMVAFHFGGNKVGDEGILILAKGLEANSVPCLETLSLWSTSMGQVGLVELARLLRLGSFPKVTDMNLDGNVVTRRAAEAFISAFRQNKNLLAGLHIDWPSASFPKRVASSTRSNLTLSLAQRTETPVYSPR